MIGISSERTQTVELDCMQLLCCYIPMHMSMYKCNSLAIYFLLRRSIVPLICA